MARVTGIGGVFVRSHDPAALAAWYAKHLGVPTERYGGATFHWAEAGTAEQPGSTTWAAFPLDTTYFGSPIQQAMINFRVDDLDGLLASLRAAGVTVLDDIEDSEYGRFGWCIDCEGNRVELWEPATGM
ncbi:MAG TPA: VOC family protein [Pseudonocardiaceae bacterium]